MFGKIDKLTERTKPAWEKVRAVIPDDGELTELFRLFMANNRNALTELRRRLGEKNLTEDEFSLAVLDPACSDVCDPGWEQRSADFIQEMMRETRKEMGY